MKKFKILALLISSTALFAVFSGCGAPKDDCPSGQVKSAQYGCLSQSYCQSGYGLYNNQCVALNGSNLGNGTGGCPAGYTYYNGSCVPQQGGMPNGGTSCPNTCGVGRVQTQYGCLQQSQYCQPCQGAYYTSPTTGYCVN